MVQLRLQDRAELPSPEAGTISPRPGLWCEGEGALCLRIKAVEHVLDGLPFSTVEQAALHSSAPIGKSKHRDAVYSLKLDTAGPSFPGPTYLVEYVGGGFEVSQ